MDLNIFGGLVERNFKYKDLACFYVPTAASEFFSDSPPLSLVGFLHVITSHWKGKSRSKYTCHGWFTEQFSDSKPGSGASFTVTGGFLKTATSSLKRVTGRIFKISKCFQRSK